MKKVLLVGNCRHLVDKENGPLARSCFSIVTTPSNEEALRVHADEKVSLIVTDLDSAGFSGEEFCRRVRGEPALREVSIILICSGEEGLKRASACKANSFLKAPVTPTALAEEITRLLNVSKRESYRVIAHIEVEGHTEKRSIVCRSLNISTSGILIETVERLKRDEKLKCTFFLPGFSQINVQGEIARAYEKPDGKFEYGIKFLSFGPGSLSALQSYVKNRS